MRLLQHCCCNSGTPAALVLQQWHSWITGVAAVALLQHWCCSSCTPAALVLQHWRSCHSTLPVKQLPAPKLASLGLPVTWPAICS